MMFTHLRTLGGLLILASLSSGCAAMWAGAGAAGAATAYEAKNKHDLDELNKRHQRGEIGAQDYGTAGALLTALVGAVVFLGLISLVKHA